MIGLFCGDTHRSGLCRSADVARRSVVVVGVLTCASVCLTFFSSAQAPGKTRLYTEQELEQMTPKSPNPYLAFLPTTVEPDWAYWRSYMKIESEKRGAAMGTPATRLVTTSESEPNDTLGTANPVPGFGSGADPAATISGSFPAPPVPGSTGARCRPCPRRGRRVHSSCDACEPNNWYIPEEFFFPRGRPAW